MTVKTQAMGRCRYCGCTEEDGCRLPDGDVCAWVTKMRDVCTNPRCLTAWAAAARRVARERESLIDEARRQYWRRAQAKRLERPNRPRRRKVNGRAA